MKMIVVISSVLLSAMLATVPANAKGCLTGAVAGGAVGHYAGHHGLLGAAAGCLIGRHEASKRQREQGLDQERAHQQGASDYQNARPDYR
jgi:outer membrane lipoprotein SlyB